ncbi:hypothetical protein SESBI_21415 [Sesbania bispinosa]|nr:hypothetical protein SESBI_21415 [Sesbania bispinosa]
MIDHCHWLSLEKKLEDGLRELRWDCDTDVLDMCIASLRNDGEIEVFIEHLVVENPTFSKSRGDVGEKEGAENVQSIPEQDNESNFSEAKHDEEVEVERGCGSNIRRKRAQNSDEEMSGDETDSSSEDISDQELDDEDAQPVENFESVAATLQIDDAEVEEVPPPVRGVTRQPQVLAPPTSATNPMGTNMTFMPTPGYRAPPPPNP